MKWKNIDIGASYYCITGTFVEWLPLLNNATVRDIVCDEIGRALLECGGYVSAFVLMPDHVHLLVYLPDGGQLHRFNRLWRGRSAQRIIAHAKDVNATKVLETMARHANGKARFAMWKEQVRALAIYSEKKLYAKVNYIHANPVRRGLVTLPEQWSFSSWRFYECGERVGLDVQPLTP